MPDNYYCADNFFKKMTDLESPRKNNDCYFYYYSTCAKGDSCTFRHEPSALGCETMCSFWKEGKCLNVHCNFRHMELRKNRKAIPCYWESQPGGCKKPHCPFLHQNIKDGAASPPPPPPPTNDEMEIRVASGIDTTDAVSEKLGQIGDKHFQKPNDSLVVNFEEESDTETASTTNSPIKPTNNRTIKVKTLEEIKLEKIQAEQAAFYSYHLPDSDDLRQRIIDRIATKNQPKIEQQSIRKTKRDVNEIKIKTLDEIRAERALKQQLCDNSVTSTCIGDDQQQQQQQNESKKRNIDEEQAETRPKKKLKLQRPSIQIQQEEMVEKQTVESCIVETDEKEEIKQLEPIEDKININENNEKETSEDDTTKIDEVLLLQDDDDASNVSLKEEDELLNEIDNLLED